jgi:hypothetical protein
VPLLGETFEKQCQNIVEYNNVKRVKSRGTTRGNKKVLQNFD